MGTHKKKYIRKKDSGLAPLELECAVALVLRQDAARDMTAHVQYGLVHDDNNLAVVA